MPGKLQRFWFCLPLLACLSVSSFATEPGTPTALDLWNKGQSAMRDGHPETAALYYQQSLALDPTLARNHLSLAAAYLEQGLDDKACPHLATYLAARPEHLSIRLHFADLLLRLQRLPEARVQFERYVADAQGQGGPAARQLLHCHSQLMEIAETLDDVYEEHLHRGIGLFLLARERAGVPDADDGTVSTEGLLCKAAGELTRARQKRPEEARPYWYLSQVWSRLAQRHPAQHCLRQAEDASLTSQLTPAERRDLSQALLLRDTEGWSRR
jgi:predicted Zn-dependent protease